MPSDTLSVFPHWHNLRSIEADPQGKTTQQSKQLNKYIKWEK
jgi:hypothetical protein